MSVYRKMYAALNDVLAPELESIHRQAFVAGRLAGIREAAEMVKPIGKRPCDCEPWQCYCCKPEDAASVAAWDQSDSLHAAILSLALAEGKEG